MALVWHKNKTCLAGFIKPGKLCLGGDEVNVRCAYAALNEMVEALGPLP
jgi:hypothetical protein